MKIATDKVPLTALVLGIVAAAGVVSLAAIAPGALALLQPFAQEKRRYRSQKYLEGIVGKLQKQKLVTVYYKQGEAKVRLTEKGERKLAFSTLKARLRQKKKWDGKWRLVIFDIHEFQRTTRDRLRKNIARLGFLKLQNSVWAYPYECEEIITLLKADCRLGRDLLYIVTERIEGEDWLKQKFHLK